MLSIIFSKKNIIENIYLARARTQKIGTIVKNHTIVENPIRIRFQ